MEEKINGKRVTRRLDFKEIISLNIGFMQGFGYLLPDVRSEIARWFFLVYAAIFVVFIVLGMVTSEVTNIVMVMGDIEKVTDASFLTLTHVVQVIKLSYVYKYQSRVRTLVSTINRKEFQPRNVTQYVSLKSYIRTSKRISKIFLTAGFMTCSFWGLYPFTIEAEIALPLAGWFPFDTSYSPIFEITYVYQVVASTLNALANISLDTFISGLIMVLCAQLNILNDSLQNIRLLAENELEEVGIKAVGGMTKELQEKMDEKLLECVIHHRYIIEFAKEVTFLFSKSLLGQFAVSVFIICLTLFEISLLPVLNIKFFSMILYQFCMLLEIYLLCYYGNEVIRESTELTKRAFCSEWMDCSQEFKRNLVIFMTRSQMALQLYAGGFIRLSLETFVKILKSSWSYYAVLNGMHSEK